MAAAVKAAAVAAAAAEGMVVEVTVEAPEAGLVVAAPEAAVAGVGTSRFQCTVRAAGLEVEVVLAVELVVVVTAKEEEVMAVVVVTAVAEAVAVVRMARLASAAEVSAVQAAACSYQRFGISHHHLPLCRFARGPASYSLGASSSLYPHSKRHTLKMIITSSSSSFAHPDADVHDEDAEVVTDDAHDEVLAAQPASALAHRAALCAYAALHDKASQRFKSTAHHRRS